jgi:glycine hydroxymethyltransferase
MSLTPYLEKADPEIAQSIRNELRRQSDQIEMIASENFTSCAVMEAAGSVMTNKYAEGYPGRRYYSGCVYVDVAENLAIERACKLFKCAFANVQPHSGSQANQGVFLALLQPGDTILGMGLESGGHLTHGAAVNLSGKWFNPVFYGVRREDGYIDYDEVERQALTHRPKLIIAGGSSYPRKIDFARFRQIADQVGAYFMVDMAHFAGLVAAEVFPSPIPYAHVVTTTTHKTLRGPRGGMILTNEGELAKKINSAIFPGIQGGPLIHIIAGKAVAFLEALQPSFKVYAQNILTNARVLGETLVSQGLTLVSGGTDSHLILVDLTNLNITGADATHCLERAGITCNKNSIPYDPLPWTKTSGIRLGSPAATTRGLGAEEFKMLGQWIYQVLHAHAQAHSEAMEKDVRQKISNLCARFPLYPEFQP